MTLKSLVQHMTKQQIDYMIDNRGEDDLPLDLVRILQRKKHLLARRDAEVVKCEAYVSPIRDFKVGEKREFSYVIHLQYLIKQRNLMYIEEERMERLLLLEGKELVASSFLQVPSLEIPLDTAERDVTKGKGYAVPYRYNRLEAVKYAEAWWNGRNPAYRNFQDNCTNFISQCLHAGETPMTGYPNVGSGWWQRDKQWSWSWAVAHSFQLYLSKASSSLQARQVERPEELLLGDIIAYDFENDGRWNHTTIVTAKDADGMPLVNAHSADSRRRYWGYEDSSKYTPQMRYKFFHILDYPN